MQYCAACLSRDRRVVLLKDLQQILPLVELLNLNLNMDEDHICWECRAILCRIQDFKTQVVQAQNALKILSINKIIKKITPLTKLCVSKKYSYDETFVSTDPKCEIIYEENSRDLNYEVDYIEDWDKIAEVEEKVPPMEEDKNGDYITDVGASEIKSTIPDVVEGDTKQANVTNHEYSEPEDQLDFKEDPKTKLSQLEQLFVVTRMTFDEMYAARDQDRNATVYKRCPFKCSKCIVGYFDERLYKKHVKEKHTVESTGKKHHQCSICSTKFALRPALERHYDLHFRRYACRSCAYSHHRLAAMMAHRQRAHSQGAGCVCLECGEVFQHPGRLRYHKNQHRERPKCDICGKTYSNKTSLKYHMTVHTGVIRVQCPDCGRTVRKTSLFTHRRTHRRTRDESAYCAECGVQFASIHSYKKHLDNSRAHGSTEKRFKCSQCDAMFREQFTLKRHVMSKHLKILPFNCHICDKGFIRKDRLQKHIQERHEGISPPRNKICVFCKKGFKTKMALTNHVRIHTGERPFSCQYCGASFTQSSTRDTHIKGKHKDIVKSNKQ